MAREFLLSLPLRIMEHIREGRNQEAKLSLLRQASEREAAESTSRLETQRLQQGALQEERESLYGRSQTLPLATPRQPLGGQETRPGAITLTQPGTTELEEERAAEKHRMELITTIDKRPVTQEDYESKANEIKALPGGTHFLGAVGSFMKQIEDSVDSGVSVFEVGNRINAWANKPTIKKNHISNLQIAKKEALKHAKPGEEEAITQNFDAAIKAWKDGTFVNAWFPMVAEKNRLDKEARDLAKRKVDISGIGKLGLTAGQGLRYYQEKEKYVQGQADALRKQGFGEDEIAARIDGWRKDYDRNVGMASGLMKPPTKDTKGDERAARLETLTETAKELRTTYGKVATEAQLLELLKIKSGEYGKFESKEAQRRWNKIMLEISPKTKKTPAKKKGKGFLGTLRRPDGKVSTELSVGVNIDGKEMEIPTLVPTLDKKEIDYLLGGNKPTEEIIKKAVEHARKRIAEGKSPFYNEDENKQSPSWTSRLLKTAPTLGTEIASLKRANR